MLAAHANTTSEDFIAQLRTYVIAMGLSPLVVDCVDKLTGVDDLEKQSEEELDEAEEEAREGMKKEILGALDTWFNEQFHFPEDLKKSLLAAIEKVEA